MVIILGSSYSPTIQLLQGGGSSQCIWCGGGGGGDIQGAGMMNKTENKMEYWISQIRGTFSGGSYNKDYSILRSILGCPYFGKVSYRDSEFRARSAIHKGMRRAGGSYQKFKKIDIILPTILLLGRFPKNPQTQTPNLVLALVSFHVKRDPLFGVFSCGLEFWFPTTTGWQI